MEWSVNKGVIITTNNIAATLDLNIIEKYVKDLNNVDLSNIISSRLFQSKSYMKVLGIPYYIEDNDLSITTDIVERVIQKTHIFNNVILESCPYIIKISPKSDMAIIWVDIWDFQNSTKAKMLINRYFTIG